MAEHRPFPPSPRRSALARSTGLTAASPIVVGAIAGAAVLLAAVAVGRGTSARLGAWIAAACAGRATLPTAATFTSAVLDTALPVLAAAGLAAVLAHLAQTRALWLPRRRLPRAPVLAPRRGVRAGLDLGAALVIGAVTVGWLWTMAPRLAALPQSPGAAGLVLASFAGALVVAWVLLGAVDALVRHADLAHALRMTAADKREDERLAAADPRWRARRTQIARGPTMRDAVASSSVVLLGDDLAVAVAWDPVHRPVPLRTATGRAARATQLLGLARRHAIAVHRDADLAAQLAGQADVGPVPELHWPRLAEIIAATRGRTR